jgi:ferritin-like protein
VLPDELAEQIEAAQKTSKQLAARIAQLGAAITADPTEFVHRSPISRLELPADYGGLPGILAIALTNERFAIARYAELAERVREADPVTHRLLSSILAHKLARGTNRGGGHGHRRRIHRFGCDLDPRRRDGDGR